MGVVGVTEQVPVPAPQPASAAVYHILIFPEMLLLSFTQSQYQVAVGTAFQM
jgi:hypothetical protein